jgi:uncharacterized repeat protein (TIGR03803 family)
VDDGQSLFEPLNKGDDGMIFGVADGGLARGGTIFSLTTGDISSYSIIRHISLSGDDARNPTTGLVEGADGFIYGITHEGGRYDSGTLFRVSPDGGNYQVLHHFDQRNNGAYYPSDLIEASNGFLYGTSSGGGASGVIFRIAGNGSDYCVIHRFGFGDDGRNPTGIVEGKDGRLFGTTANGGQANGGTVFAMAKDGGEYQVLRSVFYRPLKGVTQASDGWLYGVTSTGGTNYGGTIFKLRTDGTGYETILHIPDRIWEFDGPSQLIEGNDGLLYGTNREGGQYSHGSVFRLRKDGAGFTNLYEINPQVDVGGAPLSGVIQGRDGALYGTTGGTWWALFRINTDGSGFRCLRHFTSPDVHGSVPMGRLLEARDGRLYGTTSRGGEGSLGTIFRLTTVELTHLEISAAGSGTLLEWNAVPGVRYRIHRKSDLLDGNWTDLSDEIVVGGTAARHLDTEAATATGRRFYRLEIFPAMQ